MYPEPDKPSQTRYVDKLVKVCQRDGQEEWILVHVEVQGYHDKTFPARMFEYYCRIADRHHRPVTALAIFTGQDGRNTPDHYVRSFMGSELMYRYNTLYISDYTDETLKESNNPFAVVVLAAKKALINHIFMEQIDLITGKKNTMGIIEQLAQIKSEEAREEGLQTGLAQGQEISSRIFVEYLLKSTEFSLEKIASLAKVSVDFVHIVNSTL